MNYQTETICWGGIHPLVGDWMKAVLKASLRSIEKNGQGSGQNDCRRLACH